MLEKILNEVNISVFVKDKHSRFIYCNQKYAERAGLDSPNVAIGKSDFDFQWHENAELYQQGDQFVLQGGNWNNIVEPQKIDGKVHKVLVTKSLHLCNNTPYIFGSFHDVSDLEISKKNGYFDPIKKRFYLSEIFNNRYLTISEFKVFRYVLQGYTAKRIAGILKLSPKTIESYIQNIKLKLDCETKGDVIAAAILNGLTFILSEAYCEL